MKKNKGKIERYLCIILLMGSIIFVFNKNSLNISLVHG
jgi:hypothetical protein